jgi:ribonuclease T2
VHRFAGFALVLALLFAPAARAETSVTGNFVAQNACPALQSIRKATSPGNVALTPGTSYRIVAGNTTPPTYYWIIVPGADPQKRWVAVSCGTAEGTGSSPTAAAPAPAKTPGRAELVLAASWQPAFCENQAKKPECQAQAAGSFETTHFSLHGLWPQPRNRSYCNVAAADRAHDKAHNWPALPAVPLSAATRTALDAIMPGTQSGLERHEWIVHGTCYGTDADRYFADAVAAMAALNASPVRDLFAQNIGKELTLPTIRAAFDKAFGDGAGQRVRVACEQSGNRRLITELTIGLSGTIAAGADLAPLILAAAPTDGGCPAGIVDAVGRQ